MLTAYEKLQLADYVKSAGWGETALDLIPGYGILSGARDMQQGRWLKGMSNMAMGTTSLLLPGVGGLAAKGLTSLAKPLVGAAAKRYIPRLGAWAAKGLTAASKPLAASETARTGLLSAANRLAPQVRGGQAVAGAAKAMAANPWKTGIGTTAGVMGLEMAGSRGAAAPPSMNAQYREALLKMPYSNPMMAGYGSNPNYV